MHGTMSTKLFSYISTLKTGAAGPTAELEHLEGTIGRTERARLGPAHSDQGRYRISDCTYACMFTGRTADKEPCAGLFLMSDTDEKVHTELPNSLLATRATHRSLKQFQVSTDLRKILYLKVAGKMFIYTDQSSRALDMATHLRV
jgi:hypothetical protein